MAPPAPFQIGSDTGGTFTDTVVSCADGQTFVGKALTTHGDLQAGVLDSMAVAARAMGLSLRELLEGANLLAHGTTVGLNALLTGQGARTGLITTAGFESTLAIARSNKIHGLPNDAIVDATRWSKPDLLVPRRMTFGVTERIDARGDIVVPLDRKSVVDALDMLVAQGVEALAVATLWSTANPAHELEIARIAHDRRPDLPVSLSHQVASRIGEYERTATCVLNAYVRPLVRDYLGSLAEAIRCEGFDGRFLVMTMGGCARPGASMMDAPVHMLQSGPIGGLNAASHLSQALRHNAVIATDVGGTSFDVGLILNNELPRAFRPRICRHGLAIPVVEIASIGTGGGSIARFDKALGILRVGPESAGSTPGPVCYGRGGTEPTLTDAAATLGYINRLGAMDLDLDAARKAVERLAQAMSMSVEHTAQGIVNVACAQMADLIRRTTIQHGHDPAFFELYAYGGAAPQYAGLYAAELGLGGVTIPHLAPEFSAWGAICTELAVEVEADLIPQPFADAGLEIGAALERLTEQATMELGTTNEPLTIERRAGLRFSQQIHDIKVSLPASVLDQIGREAVERAFRRDYEKSLASGANTGDGVVEIVSLSVKARSSSAARTGLPLRTGAPEAPSGIRKGWFNDRWQEVPCYRLERIASADKIIGPAFLESEQTTVVVRPGSLAELDNLGNIRLTIGGMAR